MNRFVAVALLVIIGCIAGNVVAKSKCSGKFCVNVLGQSGKIRITPGNTEKGDMDSLTFELDYIKELDAAGDEVGKSLSQKEKHSLNSFATVPFTFSDFYETSVMGVKADAFNFTADITGPGATLVVEMFFIKENKTMTLCEEEYNVKAGTVKFNIHINGWTFCKSESCGKGSNDGAFVQLAALVKAPKDKQAKEDKEGKTKDKKENGKNLILDDLVMKFPIAVDADGQCNTLVETYPKFETKGSKQITTFRFKKFSKYAKYDPIVESVQETSKDNKASTAKLSVLVVFFAILVKLLA